MEFSLVHPPNNVLTNKVQQLIRKTSTHFSTKTSFGRFIYIQNLFSSGKAHEVTHFSFILLPLIF